MSELRNEVLQAEVAIRELAEELARAKGIVDSVAAIERRLGEAVSIMERSCQQEEQLHSTLNSTANNIVQSMKDFGDRVSQILREARADLNNATNILSEVKASFNQRIGIVQQSLEQVSQALEKQNAVIEQISKWIKICLICIIVSILSNFVVIALIFTRR